MDSYSDAATLDAGQARRVLADGMRSAVAALVLTAALQVVADRDDAQDILTDCGERGVTNAGRN
jgi:hypothetical protein